MLRANITIKIKGGLWKSGWKEVLFVFYKIFLNFCKIAVKLNRLKSFGFLDDRKMPQKSLQKISVFGVGFRSSPSAHKQRKTITGDKELRSKNNVSY